MAIMEPDPELEKKLQSGIAHLVEASRRLVMQPSEIQSIDAILARNREIVSGLVEAHRERTIAQKQELKKLEQQRKAERQRKIEEGHKKTGFTGFVVRTPGSFESNKK